MCRWGGGGGGDLLYFLCLISNTLPQLEPSSLQPPSVLHPRYLLQATCYSSSSLEKKTEAERG